MSPSWITHATYVLLLLSASTGVLLRGTFAYHHTTYILCLDKLKEIFNEFKTHMPDLTMLLFRKHVGDNVEPYLNRLNICIS